MPLPPPDHPELPFEGGLPALGEAKRKRRRASYSIAPLPEPTRLLRLGWWLRQYAQDVTYGVAVKIGTATVLLIGGAVIGDQAFDMFGRFKRHLPSSDLLRQRFIRRSSRSEKLGVGIV